MTQQKNPLLSIAEKYSRHDLEDSSKRKIFAKEVRSLLWPLLAKTTEQQLTQELTTIYWLLPPTNEAKWILLTIISWINNAKIDENDNSIKSLEVDKVLNDSFYGWSGDENLTQAHDDRIQRGYKNKKTIDDAPDSSIDDAPDSSIDDAPDSSIDDAPDSSIDDAPDSMTNKKPSRRSRQKENFFPWKNKKTKKIANIIAHIEKEKSLWNNALYLGNNELWKIWPEELTNIFATLPEDLRTLHLGSNDLWELWSENLARAFATLPEYLHTLDLSNNNLDKLWSDWLAIVLAALPKHLDILYLESNNLLDLWSENLRIAFWPLSNWLKYLLWKDFDLNDHSDDINK